MNKETICRICVDEGTVCVDARDRRIKATIDDIGIVHNKLVNESIDECAIRLKSQAEATKRLDLMDRSME